MKKYCYILFAVLVLSASKCKETNCEIEKDCFPDRKTVHTIEEKNGKIKEVTKGLFAIVTENGNSRYAPCNMDKKWHQEGMKVRFCGIEKATLPHERRAASPFVLGHIEKIKN